MDEWSLLFHQNRSNIYTDSLSISLTATSRRNLKMLFMLYLKITRISIINWFSAFFSKCVWWENAFYICVFVKDLRLTERLIISAWTPVVFWPHSSFAAQRASEMSVQAEGILHCTSLSPRWKALFYATDSSSSPSQNSRKLQRSDRSYTFYSVPLNHFVVTFFILLYLCLNVQWIEVN